MLQSSFIIFLYFHHLNPIFTGLLLEYVRSRLAPCKYYNILLSIFDKVPYVRTVLHSCVLLFPLSNSFSFFSSVMSLMSKRRYRTHILSFAVESILMMINQNFILFHMFNSYSMYVATVCKI